MWVILIKQESTLACRCLSLKLLQLLDDGLHLAVDSSRDEGCDMCNVITCFGRCALYINFGLQHTLTFENVFHLLIESAQVYGVHTVHCWDFDLAALESLAQGHVMSAVDVLSIAPSLSFLNDTHFHAKTAILPLLWI